MNRISGMLHDQIITLWRAGKSGRWIAQHLGINRETVSEHLHAEGYALPLGRPSPNSKPAILRRVPTDSCSQNQPFPGGVPTDSGQSENRPVPPSRCPPTTPSACEPQRAFIEERAALGQSAQVIWQDLVDGYGFSAGYDSVKRFIHRLKLKTPEVFAVIPTEPGLEAQVDYGRGAPTIHPRTGKLRRPRLFSMKLSHSRKAFRKVVWESSARVWCELHEEGFRHFGGVPKVVRLDNLKEGVLKPDIYDPQINPLYAAMLAHYGATAVPCRVATPRHKGKSESDIKYAQNALKGRKFETLEAQQDFLRHWDERWASTRIHGTTKRQVQEVFEREEKPALLPLPQDNFPILQTLVRKVHADGHVKVNNAYYSAPAAYVHREVVVHAGRTFIDIFEPHSGNRLARHLVTRIGRYQTDSNHLPERKRLDGLHERLCRKAAAIGQNTSSLVEEVLKQQPYHAIRQVQGVMALTRKYPPELVETAAKQCVERGWWSYRGIKRVVEHLAKNGVQTPQPALTQQHELIREAHAYQELWRIHEIQPQGGDPC